MGRDVTHAKELTQDIRANAENTVECTNKLFKLMEADGVDTSRAKCNSGWRPKAINNATPGSDPNSPHVTAEAIDLSDADGRLKKWVGKNPGKVKEAGFIATEEFKYTGTWLHLQTRPPLSWQKGAIIWLANEDNWQNNLSDKTLTVLA